MLSFPELTSLSKTHTLTRLHSTLFIFASLLYFSSHRNPGDNNSSSLQSPLFCSRSDLLPPTTALRFRSPAGMGRSPCCEKVGLKKGPWTPDEDQKLLAYIEEHGHGSWRALPAKAGLQRCGKSCRLRWTNYLRPDIKRGKFSLQEEQTIIQLHALLGNRWSAIATHLPKRTDNEIKNYWNTHLKKRLAKMGIDPVTHRPKSDLLSSADGHSKNASDLSHMAQWESARLEAEARLVRESKLRSTTAASPTSPSTTSTASFPATATPLDMVRVWQGVLSRTNKRGGRIDLASPTSTLSFSENNNNTIRVETTEGAEWKRFVKPMRASDDENSNNDRATTRQPMEHMGGLLLEPPLFGGGGENPWLNESLKHGNGNFGDGFTEMIMEKYSDEQNSSSGCCCAGSGNEENIGGSAVGHENEEENKSYWNHILNLVNSGSDSGSPPLF